VRAIHVGGGTIGVAVDASEGRRALLGAGADAEAHRRTLDQLSSGVAVFDGQRRLAFYNDSTEGFGTRRCSSTTIRRFSVLDRLRAARKLPEQADLPGLEGEAARSLCAIEPAKDTWYCPTGAPERRHHAQSKAASPICSTRHRKPRSGAPVRRIDPGAARDARQPREGVACSAVTGVRNCSTCLRQDVEALARRPLREDPISIPSKPGASRCSTTRGRGDIREAIPAIENRIDVLLKLERKDGSVLDCMSRPLRTAPPCLPSGHHRHRNVERALRESNEALKPPVR